MTTINWDDSLREFIAQAGSSQPTPGGGSVSAVVAALGAAMTSMVSNLSLGEKYGDVRSQIEDVLARMRGLSTTCERMFHADITSFGRYMEALKLPRGTEEEKEHRTQALQRATVDAIEVPLRLIKLCKEGLMLTLGIAKSANRQVISDLGIAAILFAAAAESSLLTVEINLSSLQVNELRQHYAKQATDLIESIEQMKSEALAITRSRM